jgi:HSP20 family protein
MAEPQANQQSEQARNRGNAAPTQTQGQAQRPEPRSFEEGRNALSQAAQPVIEGGRQMAEQSRLAGRQMADAWRQAFDPFLALQLDVSQWFDEAVRQTFGFRTAPAAHPLRPFAHLSPASLFGQPPSDMKETEKAYVISVELPGLKPADIDVSLVGDSLVICGHKAEETEDVSASYRVSERRYGRFERAFPLPLEIDRGRIEAEFRDGLLRLTLPKTAQAAQQRARIPIRG